MKRRLPLATLAILAVSVVAYWAELAGGGMSACRTFGFIPVNPSLEMAFFSIWLHDPDDLGHIAGNLAVLVVVGPLVERVLGRVGLVALFVASGMGGALMHLVVEPESPVPLVGMSGGLTGLLAVGAAVRPRQMLGFVASYVGMNVIWLFATTPFLPANASVGAHIGGFCVGVLVAWVVPMNNDAP